MSNSNLAQTHASTAVHYKMPFGGSYLDAYRYPDSGIYYLSIDSITSAINMPTASFPKWFFGDSLEAITHMESKIVTIQCAGAASPVKGVLLEVALGYWWYCANHRNAAAYAIVCAALLEYGLRRMDDLVRSR